MICCLCLKDITEVINIFDEIGAELNVSAVLAKYFWFQPTKYDPISNVICKHCWIKVSDFHQFYLSVEEAHRLLTERFPIKTEAYDSLEFQSNSSGSLEDTLIELGNTSVFLTDDSLNDVKYEENDEEFIMEDPLHQEENDFEPEKHLTTRHGKINRRTAAAAASADEETNETRVTSRTLENTDDEVDNEEGDNKAPSTKATKNASKTKRKSKFENDSQIAAFISMICDICGTQKPNFLRLRQHMKAKHSIEEGYVVCCARKFHKRAQLWYHVQKHLNPDANKCESCQKVFSNGKSLRHHMLNMHLPEEEKTFACEHCPKKFDRPYFLQQHRISHEAPTHSSAVQPRVQCDECGSWHKSKLVLKLHKRHHNEDGIPHTCNICGKVSPNRKAHYSHQLYMHRMKRSYECGICKKAFKKPINLKEHMTMHTGEVLYRCPHCPKTYNSNANMHSHRKKEHPKEFEEFREKRRGSVEIPTVLEIAKVSI